MRQSYVPLLAARLYSLVVCAQSPSWAPEGGVALSTSTAVSQPLHKPTKIGPFSIVLFRSCEAQRDHSVKHTGELGIDTLLEHGRVGFKSGAKDGLIASSAMGRGAGVLAIRRIVVLLLPSLAGVVSSIRVASLLKEASQLTPTAWQENAPVLDAYGCGVAAI